MEYTPCQGGEIKLRTKDVVARTGLSKDTLRYYESMGLVTPNRTNYSREYSEKDIERLEHIKLLKHLDYSLKEIQQFVDLDERFESIEAIEAMTESDQKYILSLLSERIIASEGKIAALQENLERLWIMKQRVEELSSAENGHVGEDD